MCLIKKHCLHNYAVYWKFPARVIVFQIIFLHKFNAVVLKISLPEYFPVVLNLNLSFNVWVVTLLVCFQLFSHTKFWKNLIDSYIFSFYSNRPTAHSGQCEWFNSVFFLFCQFICFAIIIKLIKLTTNRDIYALPYKKYCF